jgi:hypothetical protein
MEEPIQHSADQLAHYEARINFIEQISEIPIKVKYNDKDDCVDPFNEVMILSVCLIDGIANEYYKINQKYLNERNKTRFTKFLIKFSGNPFFEDVHPMMLINYINSSKYFGQKCKDLIEKIKDYIVDLVVYNKMYSQGEFKKLIKESKLLTSNELNLFVNQLLPNGTGAAYFYEYFRCKVVHTSRYDTVYFGFITCREKEIGKIDHRNCVNALKNIFNAMKNISLKSNIFLKEIN